LTQIFTGKSNEFIVALVFGQVARGTDKERLEGMGRKL